MSASSTETAQRFVAYFYCNGCQLSLGISICLQNPNVEIHLPFGFIRIGWEPNTLPRDYVGSIGNRVLYRSFGLR